jgi:asparagine synthase (glutamine-hydrolysing)
MDRRVPGWLNIRFRKRYKQAILGYPQRRTLGGYAPSFQENLDALEGIRRQLSIVVPNCRPPHQVWYPYLDRDLLEFLFAVPSEQICRPGQRRSLMRRSLSGIVPAAVLDRKRKASITRAPFISVAAEWARLTSITESMHCDSFGIVDQDLYRKALRSVRDGQDEMTVPLLRCIGLELWLRHAIARNVLSRPKTNHGIPAAEWKGRKTGLHPPSVLDV